MKPKPCQKCGQVYHPTAAAQRYCPPCKQDLQAVPPPKWAPRERLCSVCKQPFLPPTPATKVCGAECWRARKRLYQRDYGTAHVIPNLYSGPCAGCGTMLTNSTRWYCSNACAKQAAIARRSPIVTSTLHLSRSEKAALRDAFDGFKPLTTQVQERFREAQGDKGTIDEALRSQYKTGEQGIRSGKPRPGMQRRPQPLAS